MTADFSSQRDELAAISAIYGDDWICENINNQTYSIELKSETTNDGNWDKFIRLEFKLPNEYPSKYPPTCEISAPWMSRTLKSQLKSHLDQIYEQNKGESILYLWIDKAKEYLYKESDVIEISEPIDDELDIICFPASKEGNQTPKEESVEIIHGEPVTDRRSAFQAHVARVDCLDQVKQVVETLKQNKKIATATHNIVAYRLVMPSTDIILQDCDDDGETHAGSRLLHLLQILDAKNVVVVVSRWFGGIQLGPDRFKHINNVARDILDKSGFLSSVPQKKSSKKTK